MEVTEIVLNDRQEPIIKGNNILIIENGEQVFSEITADIKNYLTSAFPQLFQGDTSGQSSSQQNNEGKSDKVKWSRDAILCLLDEYRETREEFFNSGKRSHVIWDEISTQLAEKGHKYTGLQCKWKFNALKSQYTKKKDNIKTTGASPYEFAYYHEMNDIFSRSHSVNPVSLANSRRYSPPKNVGGGESCFEELEAIPELPSAAGSLPSDTARPSNSRGPSTSAILPTSAELSSSARPSTSAESAPSTRLPSRLPLDDDNEEAVPVRRRRRTVSEVIEEQIEKSRAEKEKRHKENQDILRRMLQLQERQVVAQENAVEVYKEYMSKLLEKM